MVMPATHPRVVAGSVVHELLAVADVEVTEQAAAALDALSVTSCWTGSQLVDFLLVARDIRLAENGDPVDRTAPVDVLDIAAMKEALR